MTYLRFRFTDGRRVLGLQFASSPGFSLLEDHVLGAVAFRLTSEIFFAGCVRRGAEIRFFLSIPSSVESVSWENENCLRYFLQEVTFMVQNIVYTSVR